MEIKLILISLLFCLFFNYSYCFVSSNFCTPSAFYEKNFINNYFQLLTLTVSIDKNPDSLNNSERIKSVVAISKKIGSTSYFKIIITNYEGK